MSRIWRILVFATAAIVGLSSCKFIIPADAYNLITVSQLRELKSLGLRINEGMDPPDVTGEYYCDSIVLEDSNISGDIPGDLYADMWLQFSSQLSDGSVVVSYDQSGYESGYGLGSYISGSGNDFTIFAQITGTSSGVDFKDAMVFSGTITPSGIADFEYGLILTEKSADPYDYLIQVGQGRVFNEDDLLAASYFAASIHPSVQRPAGSAR